jgi:hypothetical protein
MALEVAEVKGDTSRVLVACQRRETDHRLPPLLFFSAASARANSLKPSERMAS